MIIVTYYECLKTTLASKHLLKSSIKPVTYNNEKVIKSILDYALDSKDGQLQDHCILRRFNLAKISLEINDKDSFIMNQHHKLEQNDVTNTPNDSQKLTMILEDFYKEFLTEVTPKTIDFVWFIPSLTYKKWLCYEGKVSSILAIINNCWKYLYEFFIVAKDFNWLIYFDHKMTYHFLGDELAHKVKNNCELPLWQERLINCKYYLSYTNGLEK